MPVLCIRSIELEKTIFQHKLDSNITCILLWGLSVTFDGYLGSEKVMMRQTEPALSASCRPF